MKTFSKFGMPTTSGLHLVLYQILGHSSSYTIVLKCVFRDK
jgi:hypothetical protein